MGSRDRRQMAESFDVRVAYPKVFLLILDTLCTARVDHQDRGSYSRTEEVGT